MTNPVVTVAIPSLNHGEFLDAALSSVFSQDVPVEVFVLDGGSVDNSLDVIKKWSSRLSGWRSWSDGGQAAAINEGVSMGSAPFVCWLNSDDWFMPRGLIALINALRGPAKPPAAYGRAWNIAQKNGRRVPVWVETFDESRLAIRCIISQPATMIRRKVWERLGGLDEKLHMAMDYDLWWRLYKQFGVMQFINEFVACNRDHDGTKTRNLRVRHYKEAMAVVRQHYGRVPLKWWLAQPYSVWFKSIL
jgi:glycosyltransferase involved in cell wall biosynthesis